MSDINMDIDPEDQTSEFKPFPPGVYELAITKFTPGETSTKRKMLNLELTVNDGEFLGRKLWYNLTFIPAGEPGHGLTVQALLAFGLLEKGETNLALDYADFTGRAARAKVEIETYQGKQRNRVVTAGWITGDDETEVKKPVAAAPAKAKTGRKLF